jgi:hypothetical protein
MSLLALLDPEGEGSMVLPKRQLLFISGHHVTSQEI